MENIKYNWLCIHYSKFHEFETVRILGILNWTFVWMLKAIWVCSDTGSNLIWNIHHYFIKFYQSVYDIR